MLQTAHSGRRRKSNSIRFQLILVVNSILFLYALVFLVVDFRRELNEAFADKQTALNEEAKTVLPALLHMRSHGIGEVGSYLNQVCGKMNDKDSPGHHLAVELNGEVIQANAHNRASTDLLEAMKQATANIDRRFRSEQFDLVVGASAEGDVVVYVSEDVSQLRAFVFWESSRRLGVVLAMGLIGALILNFALLRVVVRPVRLLVEKIRDVGNSNNGHEVGSMGSTEFDFLAAEINSMSSALAKAKNARAMRLAKARKIQNNLLPDDLVVPGLSFGRLYCPAEEVGGDFFDILPCSHSQWLICMADATDHGVPAAMSAAMLKTLLAQASEHSTSPGEILDRMNRGFMEVSLDDDFASLILVRIDLVTQVLTYANAGHDPAWLIKPNGESIELLATGTLLGIDESLEWPEVEIKLQSNWRLAISTDGITETFDANEKQFGKIRLLDGLNNSKSFSPQQATDAVADIVNQFRGGGIQSDDVTLLLIDFDFSVADPMTSQTVINEQNADRKEEKSLPMPPNLDM